MRKFVVPMLFGFGAGVLSVWGVGGGTLLLLCMTLLLDVEQATAQSINLLFFLPTAAVGLWGHYKNGALDIPRIKQAVPWGVAVAVAGAVASGWLDTALLRKPFGVFLLLCAGSVFWGTKKK